MSASREKKKRLHNDGAETGSVEQGKKGLGKAAKTVIGVIAAIALIAVIVFFGMVNIGYFEKHTTAATVGSHNLSPAMMNYYYASAVEENGQLLSLTTDREKPLSEQPYFTDEYASWADFLKDRAVQMAADTYATYDEAMSKGFALSEESKNAVKEQLDMLSTVAVYRAGSVDAFLAGTYGKGCTAKSYEEFVTVNVTAQEYRKSMLDGLSFTQEEQDAYYAEHAAELDGYDFRMYTVNAETSDSEDGAVTEDAKQAAEEAAKAIAEAGQNGEQAFLDAVAADYNASVETEAPAEEPETAEPVEETEAPAEDTEASEPAEEPEAPAEEPETPAVPENEFDADAATLRQDYPLSNFEEAHRQWLTDEARQSGDITFLPNQDGTAYTVFYFLGKADHSYKLPTVRHILFAVDGAEAEGEALDALKSAAKSQAEELLKEFQSGEATEEAFAELAKTKSADQASAVNGGLIENITKDAYVPAFEAWAYDEGRKAGDTGIVETEYGYHVMYFVGADTTFHDYILINSMKNQHFKTWHENLMKDFTYELVSDKYMAKR